MKTIDYIRNALRLSDAETIVAMTVMQSPYTTGV